MFCVIYFDSARVKRIWNWIQTKRGIEIQEEVYSRKISKVSQSSSKSMSSLSNFGKTIRKKFSTGSLNSSALTTGTELTRIEEARES